MIKTQSFVKILGFYLIILEADMRVNNFKTMEILFTISILVLKLLRDNAYNKNKNLVS